MVNEGETKQRPGRRPRQPSEAEDETDDSRWATTIHCTALEMSFYCLREACDSNNRKKEKMKGRPQFRCSGFWKEGTRLSEAQSGVLFFNFRSRPASIWSGGQQSHWEREG